MIDASAQLGVDLDHSEGEALAVALHLNLLFVIHFMTLISWLYLMFTLLPSFFPTYFKNILSEEDKCVFDKNSRPTIPLFPLLP